MVATVINKSIGSVSFDVAVSESYDFSNSLTDIQVEEGSNIVDHVTEDSDKITIQGFVGATSMNGEGLGRNKNIYHALLQLKRNKQPVDVVLGLDSFSNMIITSFKVDRDVSTGANLSFTMELQKIKVVKSETTVISVSSSSGGSGDQTAGTANAGKGTTETPPLSQYQQEYIKQIKAGGPAKAADFEKEFGFSPTL
ncbi:MAG: hypothetical protein LBO67_04830 [Spirochaetaceae bacterium]|jgi:hypothetical protein|nr:hypothetical protein [Spirochaetaceae bacterium]